MTDEELTETIKVRETTKRMLDGLKVHPRQPYDEVIADGAKLQVAFRNMAPQLMDSGFQKLGLSEEAKKALQEIIFGKWHP